MRPLRLKHDLIRQLFQERKVLTLAELRQATGCSSATIWRWLAKHGGLTSYNHNARYYTLQGIPQFDQHGLWSYRDCRFSQWGSLTRTILELVEESPAGLDAEVLGQRLHVRQIQPVLTRLVQQQRLAREKLDGCCVYFAVRKTAQQRQRRERSRQVSAPRRVALPPLEHVVALLVEIIRRPRQTPTQWARNLSRRGVPLRTTAIQAVLEHYQLDLKKGLSSS
jgi:hypothetical protein